MMMKKHYLLAIFIVLALLQLGAPLSMAWRWENVLRDGQPFYFATAPVDPYDAFRGRYIILSFKENNGPLAQDSLDVFLTRGQSVYAVLATNSEGLAVIKEVTVNKPLNQPYVKAEFLSRGKLEFSARVLLPFNRYYLPEELSGKAETEMARQARKNKKNAVALIRVKDGYGAIENIYFDGKSLLQYLREDIP